MTAESPSCAQAPRPELIAADYQQIFPLAPRILDWSDELSRTILLRRSTRALAGQAISREELAQILGFAYSPLRTQAEGGTSLFFDAMHLKTYLSVHHVDGLDSGLYRYDPLDCRLLLIRKGLFDREDEYVALGQELAGKAAVVVYHTANLDEIYAGTGERGYRYLGLDAGHIGQRINLAALKLELGVSGIGGYFDNVITELFSLPPDEAVIYVTCVGQKA